VSISQVPPAAALLVARLIQAAQRTQSPAQLARLHRMIDAALQLARTSN
jgi:hypothetical protein